MDQPILDITLMDTYSLKTMGIADISMYPNGYNISNSTIEVTAPGFKKVAIQFNPKSVNIINSNSINLTCSLSYEGLASLPDGIYTLRYSISPNQTNFVEKSFMRIEQLECKYATAFLYLDLDDTSFKETHKGKLKKLDLAKIFMKGSIAAVNECDHLLGIKLYKKAQEIIEDIIDGECKCD